MSPGRPRKLGIEPTIDGVRVNHLLECGSAAAGSDNTHAAAQDLRSSRGPQPGIFQTAQAQIPCGRRDSIGDQPRGGAGDWRSSPRKEGARRHPRRPGFALHLCRSDVHVRGVRDACNSLITTRRRILDTDLRGKTFPAHRLPHAQCAFGVLLGDHRHYASKSRSCGRLTPEQKDQSDNQQQQRYTAAEVMIRRSDKSLRNSMTARARRSSPIPAPRCVISRRA